MMKKRTWILSMILTIIFAFSTNGYSQLISVSINPFIAQPFPNPAYSNSSTGGTFNALVTVSNTSSSINWKFFQLQTLPFLTINSTSSISNGWSPLLFAGGLQLFGPPPLASGASFSFVMNYTFASTISALNAPWPRNSLWLMNGLVAEGFFTTPGGALATIGNLSFSTGVTPEPGTLLLLGFGLLGSGFFARWRKKRDS